MNICSLQCTVQYFFPGTFLLYRIQCSIYPGNICSVKSVVQYISRGYLFCTEYGAVFILKIFVFTMHSAVIIPEIFVLYSVQCSFIPGTFVLYRVQCSIYTVYICSVQSTVQYLSREYLFCREYSAIFILRIFVLYCVWCSNYPRNICSVQCTVQFYSGNICTVQSTVQYLYRLYMFCTKYSAAFIPGIFVL
jgi:hypothetical protein